MYCVDKRAAQLSNTAKINLLKHLFKKNFPLRAYHRNKMTATTIPSTASAPANSFFDGLPTSPTLSVDLRRGSLSSNFTNEDDHHVQNHNMNPQQQYSRFLYDHTRCQMERFAREAARQQGQTQSARTTSTH